MKKIIIIAIVLTLLTFILPVLAVWGVSGRDENDSEEIIPKNAIEAAGTTNIESDGKVVNEAVDKYSKDNIDSKDSIESSLIGKSDAEIYVRVEINGKVETMTLQYYLLGVVVAEMPASFPTEALKAQTVAARTYTYSRILAALAGNNAHDNADVCTDTSHCKAYTDWEKQADAWEEIGRADYCEKVVDAVMSTDGEVILYDSKPIVAVFHAASGEYTENAKDIWGSDVPYLVSVENPDGADYEKTITFTIDEFQEAISYKYPEAVLAGEPADWFGEISYTPAGGVSSIIVGGVEITGKEMRELLKLPSSNFDITTKKDAIVLNTRGYGHCVGMSQYGARALALKGRDYKEILHWYYTDVEIRKLS